MAVLEGQGYITNPLGYVTELFDVFQKNGGKFIKNPDEVKIDDQFAKNLGAKIHW